MKATKLQNNTIFWFCDHLVYEPVPLRHGLTEAPLLTVATVLPTVAGVVLPSDNNDNDNNIIIFMYLISNAAAAPGRVWSIPSPSPRHRPDTGHRNHTRGRS